MERNTDKIKRLEHELGRFQKKVTDQALEMKLLREELETALAGNREAQILVDALLAALALQYGERAADPDQPESFLGWRLSVKAFNAAELHARYEVHARRSLTGDYVVGVMERQKKEEDKK